MSAARVIAFNLLDPPFEKQQRNHSTSKRSCSGAAVEHKQDTHQDFSANYRVRVQASKDQI
jgi:hypothetical protein